jgi:hypothetical protein
MRLILIALVLISLASCTTTKSMFCQPDEPTLNCIARTMQESIEAGNLTEIGYTYF